MRMRIFPKADKMRMRIFLDTEKMRMRITPPMFTVIWSPNFIENKFSKWDFQNAQLKNILK